MDKLDLTKKYKAYYTAKTEPQLLVTEAAAYLAISGKGDPSAPGYAAHVQALYGVAYALKFACKGMGNDFTVARLEGQWWFDENIYTGISMEDVPLRIPRSEWNYRMLIRLPEYITEAQVANAAAYVALKKSLPLAKEVFYYKIGERKVVQMLHIGPFDREMETLKHIACFIQEHGLGRAGFHHEVYLSDFRKTTLEKQKTILREPVQ